MDVSGFADPYLASLYDAENRWGASDDYYLGLVMSARAVLDVGCGTGVVLGAAAERGHGGRLVGLDPAEAMLERARDRPGVDWRHGILPGQDFADEFELIIMTGHAFQELRSDRDIRDFLAAARRALRPGGHLAFETRNPGDRAWERWHNRTLDLVDPAGRTVHVRYEVEQVDGDGTDATVTFTETFRAGHLAAPRVARSRLRFAPAGLLDHLLRDAGFVVDERYGDWDRRPFTATSPEIITVASAH